MNRLVSGISVVAERKDSRRITISCAALFMLLLLLVQNENSSLESEAVIISLLGSLLAAINLSLAYLCMHAYKRETGGASEESHPLYTYLRAGGATYGTALLSIILAFFGFSTMLSVFPGESRDVGYIGLIILLMATFALSRKVTRGGL
jgi:drug/metabolite transporter (DMT)-like permease